MSGAPSAAIRFVSHLPLGYLAFTGIKLYTSVKKLEVFRSLPHGALFLEGLQMAGQAGIVAFVWNFIMWIPTASASGLVLVMIGIVDLVIAITILCAVIFQSTYLPHSNSDCRYADTWKNANGTSNFFQVASTLSDCTPREACRSYVTNWIFGIVIIVLYMLSASFNIALGSSYSPYSSMRHRSSHTTGLLKSLFGPIPRFFNNITVRPRYLYRHFSKSRQRVKSDKPTKLRILDRTTWKYEKPTALSILLSPELQTERYGRPLPHDFLLLIASRLHYTDIVNLSQASKGLRQFIFPSRDLATTRSEALRIHSCEDGSKSQCWICSSQICRSCSNERALPNTETSLHLQICRPSCSKCYRTNVCRRPARFRHSKSCKLDARWSSSSKEKEKEKEKDVWHYGSFIRTICPNCVRLSPRVQQARREARDRIELDRLARLPLACSQCRMSLPDQGPRWWVCSACFSECQHRVHPAWAENVDV